MTRSAYDPRTALLVVDVQNDFADPAGTLYVSGAEEVVEAANREVDAAVEGGAVVAYTQDWHPQSTPHFEKDGGIWPVHCVAGTWGAELHPSLRRVEGADVVRKGTGGEDGYSGFTVRHPVSGEQEPTALEDLLRRGGVQRVVVVGLATDYCVKDTALDAVRRGFDTTVLSHAVAAVEREVGDGDQAFAAMHAAGAEVR